MTLHPTTKEMFWAATSPGAQTRRTLMSGKGLALFVMVVMAGLTVGQDLQPRELSGEGAADFTFGEAPGVHGWAEDDSPVLLVRLESLEVLGNGPLLPGSRLLSAVELRGMTVADLGGLRTELSEWIGKPLTELGLDRLTEVILRHYDDHDRPMNDILIPPQDGADGHLKVEVIEGKVGEVGLSELQYFDEDVLRSGMQVNEGDLLDGEVLQGDLDWLSRNPFRRAELFAAPGEGVSADLLVGFEERRPWRIYAGYDNTGSEAVGENRWFTGFNWGNAFGLDQVLGYQFTVGDAINDFEAHSGSWEIPIHTRHQYLRFSGAWADVSATEIMNGMLSESQGTSWQVGFLYGAQLPRWGNWKQEVRAGVEFKRADNFALFGETALPDTTVDVLQFRGEWEGSGKLAGGRARLLASLVASPGNVTSNNGSSEFEAFRAGADPSYLYGRLDGSWERELPRDFRARLRATAQLASGALLPTEQLGLGGASTVRGYDERILLADSGYAFTAELYTPSAPGLGKLSSEDSSLRGLLFLDHALGWRDGDGSETLTGAGLGARLTIGQNVSGRLDLGWALENGDGAELHAGVLVSF